MPSVFDLVHESTDDLNDRCREQDVSYGSLKKHEKIIELSEESLSDSQEKALGMKKSGLVDVAKRNDVRSPHSKTKAELQAAVLKALTGGSEVAQGTPKSFSSSSGESSGEDTRPDNREGFFPPSSVDGAERAPQEGLSSHYNNAEERLAHIQEAAVEAARLSLDKKMAYVVVESFQPKDASEPIRVRPAYMEIHPDEIVVWECGVHQAVFPITNSEKNPVFRE